MKLIKLSELDILLEYSSIEECLVYETDELAWTFILHIRNHKDGTVSKYRLMSQRGQKREWSDPRALFRFIRTQYNIQGGHFKLQSCDEQTDKYWINTFMLCREGYDWNTIQPCYDKIGLMSAAQVQADYARLYNDIDGRHIKLANRARVLPHVISITPDTGNRTATVRFTTQVVHDNGTREPSQRFVATLAYRYVYDAKLTEAQRMVNLLGFQVTSYRVDGEF